MGLYSKTDKTSSTAQELGQYAIKFAESLGKEAHGFADSLKIIMGNENPNDTLLYNQLRLFHRNLFKRGLQVKVFEYLSSCIQIIANSPNVTPIDKSFESEYMLLLGTSSDEAGLRSLSHDYYFTGLKIADKYNKPLVGYFYNNIGVSCMKAGKFEQAVNYYQKALDCTEDQNNDYLSHIVNTNLADAEMKRGDYDKAIEYALRAIHFSDEKNHPDDYYASQSVIGQLYAKKKVTNMALTYLNNAFKNQSKRNNLLYLFETCMCLTQAYSDINQTDSARHYLKQALSIAEKSGNTDQMVRVLNCEADDYLKSGKYAEACKLKDKVISLKDSINKEESALKFKQAQEIYDIERDSDKRNIGMSSWNPVVVFTSMTILVIILIITMLWMLAMKKKKEMAIAERARAIADLNDFQRKQLDLEIQAQNKIKTDLESYERKLTTFTLDRIRISQNIEDATLEVKKMIRDLPPHDKVFSERLKEIVAKLAQVKSDTQWSEFQYYFERVHPNFYKRLDEHHPGLTVKDRRLCALLSLGLSTKEIAQITFREVRSVESSRNRLRKKMDIDVETNLMDYILQITRSNSPTPT